MELNFKLKVLKMGLSKMNINYIDFEALYKEQKLKSTFKGKTREDWDKKAHSMNLKIHENLYNDKFLEILDYSECNTVLDVGCGPGTFALKLATKLQKVYALDYSSKMLECLKHNCYEKSISNIELIHKSWEDDWSDIEPCDIVIASRSMEVMNIKEALEKLHNKAKKRVYITFKVGGSFVYDEILNQIEREVFARPDYIYIVNILYNMGIYAKVQFLPSEDSRFSSSNSDDFIEKVEWSLGELSLSEKERLREYFENEFKQREQNRVLTNWALIYWDK